MADEVNNLLRLSRQGRRGGVALDPNEPDVPASGLDAALMFGPVGPAASMAFRGLTAAPKVTAGAMGLLGLMAPSATAQDAGAPQPVDLTDLYKRRSIAEERRAAADAEMTKQQRTGRGPRFDEAARNAKSATDEVAAIDKAIARAEQMNSPEYRLQVSKDQAKAADEARTKRANTPFKDLYADYMPYVAPAAALTAGLTGAAIRAPYAARAAAEANDLSQRWARSVAMTPPKGPGGAAVPNGRLTPDKQLANQYQIAFRDIQPPGGDKAALAAGIGIGELSQILPLAIDYQRALPGSELAGQVHDQLTDLPGMAGRMVQGALLGGIPAKIGTKVVDSRYQQYVPQYGAETNALFARPVAGPGPGGGGGGPPQLRDPGVPPTIPPTTRRQVGPQVEVPSDRPGSSPGSSYRPDKNGATSRQYIDEQLAAGQSLPPNAAEALSGLMPGVNPASVGPRVDRTRPVVDALVGADEATRRAVLDAVIGQPGSKMLGVGAAAGGAAAAGLPDQADATTVDEFTRELAAVKALLDGLASQPAPQQFPASPFQSASPAFELPPNRLLAYR